MNVADFAGLVGNGLYDLFIAMANKGNCCTATAINYCLTAG
jgi:hypothetical protein